MRVDIIEALRKHYFEAIMELQDEQDIISAMPRPEFDSFFPIVQGLIELIEENIKEMTNELSVAEEQEFIEMIQHELKLLQYKKEICIKLLAQATEIVSMESDAMLSRKKNLIFATTEVGNIYIERDLKSLPEEYYDSVIESLEQLEFGFEEENAQKGKGFQNHNKLSGLHEIKPFKVRIFYRHLSPDTVFVLLVRMKKSNNSQLDREEAIVRNKKTQKEYDELRELIKIPEQKEGLIRQNAEIRERIFDYMRRNRRGKNG